MRRAAILLALLTVSLPCRADSPYSLRQYLSIRAAGSPTLKPDSSEVAFLTNITGTSQLWKVAKNSGWPEQLTFFPSSVGSVEWSPSGKAILAAVDDNGNEQYQFYLVRPDGAQITPLTAAPKVRHNFGGWSQDGKTIFYSSNARNPQFFDCYLMDAETKQTRLVFQKDTSLSAAALSPDGKRLVAVDYPSNYNQDIYLVDTTTQQARLLTPHEGDVTYNVIGFVADGKTLLIGTDQGRDHINLAQIDTESGKLTFLQDTPYELGTSLLSRDGRWLAYTTNRDGYQELTLWDTRTQKTSKLPALPQGLVTPQSFSADDRTLALTINTPTQNTDVWLLDIPSGKLRQVTFSSRAGIDRRAFVEPSLIRYKSVDGKEIPAWLYLPKDAPQDHSLPVILSVHGGPEGQERPALSSLYQYFVSRGYAVLAPNIRGSSGYGKAYLAADNGPKRWDALKDLAAAVDWVGTHPALDGKKVAVMGGSYGGFATLAMLAHYPDKFVAGVDMFGPADFKTFLANTASYRRAQRAAEYGDPDKDSDFLDAISPARHVDKIIAPLLVIQGANDPRVPESESRQIVEKVKAKGGVVEYLLFPDEGHGIAKLPNRIKAYEAVVAFLDKHLRTR